MESAQSKEKAGMIGICLIGTAHDFEDVLNSLPENLDRTLTMLEFMRERKRL
jgi:hypothetical protein